MDVGALVDITRDASGARLTVSTKLDLSDAAIGASIACSGVCLTVVERDAAAGRFSADASHETLSKTTLGRLTAGAPINLERALRLGDELGGHIVSGHVDGLADIVAMREDGDSTRWSVALAPDLGRFVAEKGSVTLDGVSLTVNEVEDRATEAGQTVFGVNLIPHTKAVTSFGASRVGDQLNVEVDLLARYVSRLEAARAALPSS